jgi:hypothetical protein
MRHLIIHGDPGIRKDAVIEVDGEELHCYSVKRQGDWHGPEEVQLWCTVGSKDERETFARRDFIPMHLEVQNVDAEVVEIVKSKGDLAV